MSRIHLKETLCASPFSEKKKHLVITVYKKENSGMTFCQWKIFGNGSVDIQIQCKTNNTYLYDIHISLYKIR